MQMTSALELHHKPRGATSFSLVAARKAALASEGLSPAIVHGGALDPFAEGLLPLLFGPATRAFDLLHALPKSYVATIAWGFETDTGDLHGESVEVAPASALTEERINAALAGFLGWTDQVPPAFSNKRTGGERAHVKARRGEVVVLPPSRVFLFSASVLAHDLPHSTTLGLTCRGGYYVRALATGLARALGTRAHLTALVRTAIGPWIDPPDAACVIAGPELLPWCPSRALTDDEALKVELGRAIPGGEVRGPEWTVPVGFPDPCGPVRGVHRGRLVALLARRGDELKPVIDLRDGQGQGL
jgi:tRNA pseudouridine55 synthase